MGKQYKKLTQDDMIFIKEQKLFYLASCSGGEVNLSPKGYDSIRVLNANSLLFMHQPGSGMSVPVMEYKEDRKQLRNWAVKMYKNGQLDEYNRKTFVPVDLKKI